MVGVLDGFMHFFLVFEILKSPFWKIYVCFGAATCRKCYNYYLPVYEQKSRWNSDIQNFYGQILIFYLFFAKNHNFQPHHFIWRHSYVTIQSICWFVVACMDKGDPYLGFDTKTMFIGVSVRKIQLGALATNPSPLGALILCILQVMS